MYDNLGNMAVQAMHDPRPLFAPGHTLPLGTCTPEGSTLAARIALFAATNCRAADRAPDVELGIDGFEHLTLAEASQRLRGMSIEDVSTALVLHRYFQWRGL